MFAGIMITRGEYEELQRLRAENVAMRPIVEAMATDSRGYAAGARTCLLCGALDLSGYPIPHADDCPVTQARAYIAQHPVSEVSGGN